MLVAINCCSLHSSFVWVVRMAGSSIRSYGRNHSGYSYCEIFMGYNNGRVQGPVLNQDRRSTRQPCARMIPQKRKK